MKGLILAFVLALGSTSAGADRTIGWARFPTYGATDDLRSTTGRTRAGSLMHHAAYRSWSPLSLPLDRTGSVLARSEKWRGSRALPCVERPPLSIGHPSVYEGLEEFMIDTSIVYTGAPYSQCLASVASDGNTYFVVWQDERGGASSSDIYGSRVHPSGALLDTFGIPICTATGDQWYPAVAFDGTNYLVVWSHWRGDYTDIYGARVDTSGTVLDLSPISISTAFDHQMFPSIASDGTAYLVVWSDRRSDNFDVYGARVDKSGVVLDPSGLAISTTWNDQASPSVSFDGTHYLVVWEDCRWGYPDIYGARVDPTTGAVIDPWGIPVCTGVDPQWSPSLAFDGTNYLVTWTDERNGSWDIYGARIDTAGAVLDPSGISIASMPILQICPSMTFDGMNYVVVWTDGRGGALSADIYAARVDTSGRVLDTLGITVSAADKPQWYPSVAFGDTTCLVVWTDERGGRLFEYDVYGARMTTEGTVLDPGGIDISAAANSGWFPSLAFNGFNYLVVWEDRREGSGIWGARVTPTGRVLDPTGVPISSSANPEWFPCVCSDGTSYLVAWTEWHDRDVNGDIWGTRVDASGTVLDPTGIPVCVLVSGQRCPSVAHDGAHYFVVWEDARNKPRWDIYGARVNPETGTVLDPTGIAVCTDTFDQWSCSVGFDGTNYLVVWNDYRSQDENWDIYGARVDTGGRVLDPLGIPIITADGHQVSPSVAFDGSNYLVVWQDLSRKDIYGARVDRSGQVLPLPYPEGIPISTATGEQCCPSVAFYGTNYLVVWEDWRSGSRGDIYGARVHTSGTVLDPLGVELVSQPYSRMVPDVAGGPGSQLLVAYSGLAPPPYMSQRIFGAFYDELGIDEEWAHDSRAGDHGFLNLYPNPMASSGVVEFWLARPGKTELSLFNAAGQLIRTILCDSLDSGQHRVGIRAPDLCSGTYFCRLTTRGTTRTNKVILLR